MLVLPLLTLLTAVPAFAQDLNVLVGPSGEPIWLLEPIPGHWTEGTGMGNPTVVWDEGNAQYVLFFESRIYDEWLFNPSNGTPAGLGLNPRSYDDCRLGRDPANPAIVWAIGRATSPDGFDWTVDPWPLFLPRPGTFYACQAAQPAVIQEKSNQWHLYFKAVQWNPNDGHPDWVGPCDGGATPAGGCAPVTGFGYAHSGNGTRWDVRGLALRSDTIQAATGVRPDQIGFPRVSSLGHDWYLWYTAVPRVFQAVARKPGDVFTTGATPITDVPGPVDGRLKTGAVFCRNGTPPAAMVDGVDRAEDVECGLSVIATPDLIEWDRKSDDLLMTWDCDAGWDRWEVVDMGSEMIMWYAAKDSPESTAPRRIGFAATVPLATQPPYTTLRVDELGKKVCKKAPVFAQALPTWSTFYALAVPQGAVAEPPGTPSGGGCRAMPGPIGATPLPLILLWLARRHASRARSRRT